MEKASLELTEGGGGGFAGQEWGFWRREGKGSIGESVVNVKGCWY